MNDLGRAVWWFAGLVIVIALAFIFAPSWNGGSGTGSGPRPIVAPIARPVIAPVMPPEPAAEPVDDRKVVAALTKGVNPLLRWMGTRLTDYSDSGIEELAIDVRALLIAGTQLPDPRLKWDSKEMKPAVDFLLKARLHSWHVVASRAMATAQLPEAAGAKPFLTADAAELVRAYGAGLTGSYGGAATTPDYYHFTIALEDLSRSNVEVPLSQWRQLDGYWRAAQTPAGEWPPSRLNVPPSQSSTVEGTASIALLRRHLDKSLNTPRDRNLDLGLAAVNRKFDPTFPDDFGLDAFARIGDATGQQHFDGKLWREELARTLLAIQASDGNWTKGQYTEEECTAQVVTFLAQARRPMFLSKLEHAGNWDARPYDAANLTARAARQLDRPLQWQTVTQTDPLELWQKSPLLLLTASADPKLTPAILEKLHAYTRAGGIILSTTDGVSADEAIRMAVGATPGQQFQPLPPNHLLFGKEAWKEIATPAQLLTQGAAAGPRLWWVHAVHDLSAAWQRESTTNPDEWTFPINVWAYAGGQKSPQSAFAQSAAPATAINPAPAAAPTGAPAVNLEK